MAHLAFAISVACAAGFPRTVLRKRARYGDVEFFTGAPEGGFTHPMAQRGVVYQTLQGVRKRVQVFVGSEEMGITGGFW